MNEEYRKYLNVICKEFPTFLVKYIYTEEMQRLKYIDYFCGMKYGSKKIYKFLFPISRYEHSISTALITWNFTKDKSATVAGLIHDIATPCFSHTIDYMNKDFINQESTEKGVGKIIKKSDIFKKYLKIDNIDLDQIIDFKNFSIVDLDRPGMCADRVDGIFLPSYSWIHTTNLEEIAKIYNDISIFTNEKNQLELGFNNYYYAKRMYELEYYLNINTNSNEDYYSMFLLGEIVRKLIEYRIIKYNDLYLLKEDNIINYIKYSSNVMIKSMWDEFINLGEIEKIDKPIIKKRVINPLLKGKRLL